MPDTSTLRVAIVNETADPRRGGAETSIREMAEQIALRGVEVTLVYAALGDTVRAGVVSSASIQEVALTVRGATRRARTAHFVSEADRFCRAARFDVVHAVTPLLCASVYQPRGGTYVETIARSNALAGSSWRGMLRRIGRVFNRKQQYLLRIERQLLTRADPPLVAAVSDYVARQVHAAYNVAPAHVRVVFNGVNPPTLAPEVAAQRRGALRAEHGIAAAAPVVLFLAHNFKLKGLCELLQAAASTGARAWQLVVVGRDHAEPFRAQAARLRIAERVHFVGAASSAEWFAAADMLAHPTWYDPCSRVVLEAAACGLPVVTTRYNGAAEIIQNDRTGIVIDEPDDIAALAAGIQACLQPEMRIAAGAGSVALIERVSMARHARELVNLYAEARRPG